MFRFLHAADIHLDSPLHGLESYADAPVEQLRQATRRAFDNLIELAIAERVAFLLLAGDLYDGEWRDYNTGLFFVNRMGRLRKEGIRVFLVSGNHDAASRISKALLLPDNVHLFAGNAPETMRIEELRVALHGQSYQARSITDNLAAAFPPALPHYCNIGLLHTSLTGREGHEPYAPCTLDDLRGRGYAYWALGHVHQREEVCQEPWVIFPGNIQGRQIREGGEKGATLVTVQEGRIVAAEHRPLDVLRWRHCRVDVSGAPDPVAVEEAVRAELVALEREAAGMPLAVRLTLHGRSGIHSLLHGRAYGLNENFRGLAAGLTDIWLEKLVLATENALDQEPTSEEEHPLAELLRGIAGLDFPLDALAASLPELASLKSKLPPELLHGEDDLFRNDPDRRRELREEVRALLLARLLTQSEGP